jgi:hypothetical protein
MVLPVMIPLLGCFRSAGSRINSKFSQGGEWSAWERAGVSPPAVPGDDGTGRR